MNLEIAVLEDIYKITRNIDGGGLSLSKGRDELVRMYGLNQNSAAMTLRSLRHMFNGERYRRALSLPVTDFCLNKIFEDEGAIALQRALTGLSAHIDYRHAGGVNVPGLQTLLAQHEKRIAS